MKIISIINLKGGVAKTISAINIAYTLAAKRGARVLLIDNDKQGNTSKFFGLHGYDAPSLADVLTVAGFDIRAAICKTTFERLDVLPANMNLVKTNKDILLDEERPQQTRLATSLVDISAEYDFAVIDNAPDLNMSAINALVASNDVLIPIKIDKFAFDGLDQLREQVEETREHNENIRIAGCFITMLARNNVNLQGEEYLRRNINLPLFNTAIRKTVKVDETTFAGMPLLAYSKGCTAARDYEALVDEYLSGANVTGFNTTEGSGK